MADTITLIKRKTFSGIIALVSRSFILQIIAFGSTFILTLLLSPKIFGVFYVVSAVISFMNYFSDVGLAAALIQKKDDLTEADLANTFTIQEILIGILSVLLLVLSPYVISFYNLDNGGLWLLRALIFAFFISSMKTIPSVLLERKLEFQKLIIPQILETIVFYGIAVILAWLGYGIFSFSVAVIFRAIVGLISIYTISPWRIRLGVSKDTLMRLLKFGIPFQFNSFLALAKDDMLTIYLGKILTLDQIGYIGWAKKWAEVPLRLIMDNVIRITFPTFSRLQNSKKVLARAVEKTIFGLSVTLIPMSVVMIFFMHPFVSLIPKYGKWEPALFSFSFFTAASLNAGLSTPLTNALNAIGKIKITLWLMVIWTIFTWILSLFFISVYGFNGFSIALFCITWSIIAVIILVKKYIPFKFLPSIKGGLIAGMIQICYYKLVINFISISWLSVIIVSLSGVILYLGVLYLLEKAVITKLFKDLYEFRKAQT
jgi:O-antigen/teichoic acid export membrane protein